MRKTPLLVLLAIASCTPIASGPEGRLVDASVGSRPDDAALRLDATPACEQLAPGDDPRCAEVCAGSAIDLGSGRCVGLRCPLLDGSTWSFGACEDPL